MDSAPSLLEAFKHGTAPFLLAMIVVGAALFMFSIASALVPMLGGSVAGGLRLRKRGNG